MNCWRKFLALTSLILAGVTGSQAATAGEDSRCLLGTDLARAEAESDYFQFFCLKQVGSAETLPSGGQRLVFKPSGSEFHQLVTIFVETDSKGLITLLRAVVARSFVEDSKKGIYARDLIKSTVLAAATQADLASLNDLSEEILHRDIKGTMIYLREKPHLSDTPSAAFLVVTGTNSEWQTTVAAGTIKLTNETQENRASLVIEIRGKGV
jgi:hypothetical protein